jgi:hypothetical protein
VPPIQSHLFHNRSEISPITKFYHKTVPWFSKGFSFRISDPWRVVNFMLNSYLLAFVLQLQFCPFVFLGLLNLYKGVMVYLQVLMVIMKS